MADVISVDISSLRAVAAHVAGAVEGIMPGAAGLLGEVGDGPAAEALHHAGAEWIGYLTQLRDAVAATAADLHGVAGVYAGAELDARDLVRRSSRWAS